MRPAEIDVDGLVAAGEGPLVVFRPATYDLESDGGRTEFLRDLVGLANTAREATGYVLCGVEPTARSVAAHAVDGYPDDARFHGVAKELVYPPPEFAYRLVEFNGHTLGVLCVPPQTRGPFFIVQQQDRPERQLYLREGKQTREARPNELSTIAQLQGALARPAVLDASETDVPLSKDLLVSLHNFSPENAYVLVTAIESAQLADGQPFGLAPWAMVIDFDALSDQSGLLAAARPTLERHRAIHVVTVSDDVALPNVARATQWYFARGLAGRESSLPRPSWRAWQMLYGGDLRSRLTSLARATTPRATTALVVWDTALVTDYLESTLEALLTSFGDLIEFVIAVDAPSQRIATLADKFDARVIVASATQVAEAINARFGSVSPAPETFVVPAKPGTAQLSAERYYWISEELELLHAGTGQLAPTNRELGRAFLKGSEIGWYELALHYDVNRDFAPEIGRLLRNELASRRTLRVHLYHAPGSGGSTISRRLLWDLHFEYPAAILHSTSVFDTADRVYHITSSCDLPLLLLVDGSEVTSNLVDELFARARARQLPLVILQVSRRATPQAIGPRVFDVRSTLSPSEARRFADVLSREVPEKTSELRSLAQSPELRLRTPFYFCLQAFGREFKGLDQYIADRTSALTIPQQRVMAFLAIAHHYGQRAIPSEAFRTELGLPARAQVSLDRALPAGAIELLVEDRGGEWRTAHDLVAVAVLEQILWPSAIDRARLWRQGLSHWAAEFAKMCRGGAPTPSEEMLEIVRRCFFFRDNVETMGSERYGSAQPGQFAYLLEDIPAVEGRLEVLRLLVELFPEEAHFWAHLGRFHAAVRRDFDRALECVDRALALRDDDDVLHHMRGMVLRYQVYDKLSGGAQAEDVMPLVEAAAKSFARAREIAPDNEHGYISEVQMLIRVLNRVGQQKPGGVLAYLSSASAPPILREALEHAEDLLERVRRNIDREGGRSPYEEDARGQLSALYGNYGQALQRWDNMLQRRDVYAPPIRRQIAWTLLARHNRQWEGLEPQEVQRIADLMETNLNEEPNDDRNLRLWLQAVRRVKSPPSIEAVLERVTYWKARTESLEPTFYYYVLNLLLVLQGVNGAREAMQRALDDSKRMARTRSNRTRSFEWLGEGPGISRLVHQSRLGEWDERRGRVGFWTNVAPLARLRGRIARYEGPHAGHIELAGGPLAFFVPAGGPASFVGSDLNKTVTFYLGFGYDGPRAWEVRLDEAVPARPDSHGRTEG